MAETDPRQLLEVLPQELKLDLTKLCDVGSSIVINGVIDERIDFRQLLDHSFGCEQCQDGILIAVSELIQAIKPRIGKIIRILWKIYRES